MRLVSWFQKAPRPGNCVAGLESLQGPKRSQYQSYEGGASYNRDP